MNNEQRIENLDVVINFTWGFSIIRQIQQLVTVFLNNE